MSGLVYATSAPSDYPVTRTEALLFIKQEAGTPDDALVDDLIIMATSQAEQITEMQFKTATYIQYFDGWPCKKFVGTIGTNRIIQLNKPPLISVASVRYIDQDGAEQTIDPSNYTVHSKKYYESYVVFNKDYTLPEVSENIIDSVYVEFTCGWEGWNGGVPGIQSEFKTAIKAIVAEIYQHRMFNLDGSMTGTLQENSWAMQILKSFKIHRPTGIGAGGNIPDNYLT